MPLIIPAIRVARLGTGEEPATEWRCKMHAAKIYRLLAYGIEGTLD
jgi:hypothetical protein